MGVLDVYRDVPVVVCLTGEAFSFFRDEQWIDQTLQPALVVSCRGR